MNILNLGGEQAICCMLLPVDVCAYFQCYEERNCRLGMGNQALNRYPVHSGFEQTYFVWLSTE